MPEITSEKSASQPISVLGVLGDIHAEDTSLEAALAFLDSKGIVDIVSVGDIVTGPGDANRCCRMLEKRQIPTVRGNHDRWYLRDDMTDLPHFTRRSQMSSVAEKFLEQLPVSRELQVVGGAAQLCHGFGRHDMAGVLPTESESAARSNRELHELLTYHRYRFVINGHTHHHMVRTFDDMTIINAGTLRRDHQPCLTIIDFSQAKVNFFKIRNLTEIEPWEEVSLEYWNAID
ncbi:MAG: metallophosphoesterase [Planctomycetaceae bacterium]|nr:metallophosphoesterase [Planctomycetaceae bacterium]